MSKQLDLTEKDKEIASRAAQVMGATHNDDFWTGVQKEVDRLDEKLRIKKRETTENKRH